MSISPLELPMAKLADPDWVDAAGDDEFEARILMFLDTDAPPPDCLMEGTRIDRFHSALSLHRLHAESMLNNLQAENATMHQSCFAMGRAGKSRWFAFESEWKVRRREVVQRKARCEMLLQRVKQKRSNFRETTSNRNRETMDAVEVLAKAILEHRESIEWSGGETTVSDRALWASLNRARIPHGRAGSITVRDWLMKLAGGRDGGV